MEESLERRLLVAWELGGGLGHLTAIAGVLERLPADVWVHAIVRDAKGAREWFPSGVTVEAAPPLPRSHLRPTRTYADILLGLGWGERATLAPGLTAWRAAVDRAQPDLVLTDTAPSVLAAVHGTSLPVLGFCNPWGCPPDVVPLPPVLDDDPIPREARLSVEKQILRVLRRLGIRGLDGLADLYAPHPHYLYGIPETDPWASLRAGNRVHVGPVVHTSGGQPMRFPPGPGPRIFAYLKRSYRPLQGVLNALARLDRPTVAFVPGHPETRRGRLHVTGEPVRFDSLADDTDLVVTHSVLGTGFSFLRSSVSVILLPMQLEQQAMARCCARLPGIHALPEPAVESGFDDLLVSALRPEWRAQAGATRRALDVPPDPFGRVAGAILKALP